MMNVSDQKIVDDVGMIFSTAFNHHRPLRRETSVFLKGLDGKKVIFYPLEPVCAVLCIK